MTHQKLFFGLLTLLILAQPLLADTHYWEPDAADIPQIDTITPTGTWGSGDTITAATGNSRSATLTLTGTQTNAEVAEMIKAMVNASSSTENIISAETRDFGAQEFNEFKDMIGKYTAAAVFCTVESVNYGEPYNLTVTDTSGTGTITLVATQAATGKEHYDNDDNWVQGSAPDPNDWVYFVKGSGDVKHGLTTAIGIELLYRFKTYTGSIGLPATHGTGVTAYPEYRGQLFTFTMTGLTTRRNIHLYRGVGTSVGNTFLSPTNCEDVVIDGSPSVSGGIYPIRFQGLDIQKSFVLNAGHVQIGNENDNSGGVVGPPGLTVGQIGAANGNTSIYMTDASGTIAGGIVVNSGTFTGYGSTTTIVVHSGMCSAHVVDTLTMRGGTFNWLQDNLLITTLTAYAGTFKVLPGKDPAVITNFNGYDGFTYIDPDDIITLTNGIVTVNCAIEDLNLETAEGLTWTH